MRKPAFIFFLAMLSVITMLSFVACNKDDDKPGDNNPLAGKWNVENIVIKEYLNDTLSNTNTEPGDGSTWDFQNNGQVIIMHPGSNPETHVYTIQTGSTVNIDGFVFEIRDLTSVTVTLYIRHDFSFGEYDEVFTYLKR
jgi:hypothetical protein